MNLEESLKQNKFVVTSEVQPPVDTDAEDLVGQPVGILLHEPDRVAAVMLEDLRGVPGAKAVSLEKDHDLPDHSLLCPGCGDFVVANWANPVDL